MGLDYELCSFCMDRIYSATTQREFVWEGVGPVLFFCCAEHRSAYITQTHAEISSQHLADISVAMATVRDQNKISRTTQPIVQDGWRQLFGPVQYCSDTEIERWRSDVLEKFLTKRAIYNKFYSRSEQCTNLWDNGNSYWQDPLWLSEKNETFRKIALEGDVSGYEMFMATKVNLYALGQYKLSQTDKDFLLSCPIRPLAAFFAGSLMWRTQGGGEAIELLQEASDNGIGQASSRLGAIYEHGHKGVQVDLNSARQFYERCLSQNEAEGVANLGFVYFDGIGVDEDKVRGLSYFRRSVDMGAWKYAVFVYSEYRNGKYVDIDHSISSEYSFVATATNDKDADYHFAIQLGYGRGLPGANKKYCRHHLKRAAGHGHIKASAALETLADFS